MRLVSWNVNSLKARLERVEAFLRDAEPDVLCLQETKAADAAFPVAAFEALGYASAHHGNGRWNGVAILSRVGLEQARAGFRNEERDAIAECRLLSARCGPLRVLSVYVPNGRSLDSEHYVAKLAWLERLADELSSFGASGEDVCVCGDFNVAPEDRDVWDPAHFVGATHVSAPERAALGRLVAGGFVDVTRALHPDETGPFTWWDYRGGSFHKGEGMRIDLALCSATLAERARAAYVDREARKRGSLESAPSDHAPLVVDFAD